LITRPAESTSANFNHSNNSDTRNSKSVESNPSRGGSRASYIQGCGSQRKCTIADSETGNALAVAAETTQPLVVVYIQGNMQQVKAQINCGAMTIFISPSLLRKLELPYETTFSSTLA